ncbi:MAG: GDSL-type esterase/lipase family protein, partial [Odoribacter sp.]
MRTIVFFVCFLCVAAADGYAQKIKVACVGNSVTYGYLIPNREKDCYPAQLARMLGEGYEVVNFGKSGATLLNQGHRPYVKEPEFEKAKKYAADWVVIHLGLNDTDPRDWPNYRDDFIPDYLALIDSFRVVNPTCRIWICRMSPIAHRHPRFKSGTRDWYEQIQRTIEKVAEDAHTGLIDLQEGLYCRPDLLPDALHPTAEGATILAQTVYSALTGDYGGLQLEEVYSDNMVLQRGDELKIKGRANVGEKVTVCLEKRTERGIADVSGHWEVVLKDVCAGGPYELKVSTDDRRLLFKNVMVGDVWLCSGQSNMAFMVKQSREAKELMEGTAKDRVRLFDMKQKVMTNAISWDSAALVGLNRLDYYQPSSWRLAEGETVADFSAVAYSFGRMLSDSLGVTVGLICNAVGGAPAEAFIDRKSLEFDHQLVDLLYDWKNNDMIQDWVRERAAYNVKESHWKGQRHPYEPCYLYETGIRPLKDFTIKGVIWYQGESNAHNVELHEAIFPVLVDSWRKVWGEDLPFYFVQLSSLNRPSWAHFRDSQRRLAERIEHCGMAVSSDVGHPADVHPTQKKVVGERLVRLALWGTYGWKQVVASGPMFKELTVEKEIACVEFVNGVGMKSSDGQALRGFEMAGADGLFYPAEAAVVGNRIKLIS